MVSSSFLDCSCYFSSSPEITNSCKQHLRNDLFCVEQDVKPNLGFIHTGWGTLRCRTTHIGPTARVLLLGPKCRDLINSSYRSIANTCPDPKLSFIRVPTNLENLELSENFVNLEKSGNLRYGQIIFMMFYFSRLADR